MLAQRDLAKWVPCQRPGECVLEGRTVRLEPWNAERHAAPLFAAIGGEERAALFAFMPHGPFATEQDLASMLDVRHADGSFRTMVIVPKASGRVAGMASFLRIREAYGSAEVGFVTFSTELQRTTAATEALALMTRHVFADLGYRRWEWKCDASNAKSMRAAERLGVIFEGTFRNDLVIKGRNRDTAWFSITDAEWPLQDETHRLWLDEANFAADGTQMQSLDSLRSSVADRIAASCG